MNANELADWIDERNISSSSQTLGKAATMLRQQQAEIEALKAEIVSIEKNTDYWADKANWIKPNKPVAYVSTTGLNDIEWTDASHSLNYGDALYTHPVELTELTDGELEAIRKKAWKLADDATGNCISYSLKFQVIYDREFARAILRKAQEK